MEKRAQLNITLLGTGTCVPSLERSACSLLIRSGTSTIVMDIGPTTMRRLLEAGVSIDEVDAIFLSHFHPDHTGELVNFLFSSKYAGVFKRTKPLTLVGGLGLTAFFEKLKSVYKEWIILPEPLFNLIELNHSFNDTMSYKDLTITCSPMLHCHESLAYRVADHRGNTIVYSGDTGYTENLIQLAQEADLLICECSFPDEKEVPHHLTPSLAGKIAAQANVGKLVLTHLYPECDQIDIEKQCRTTYKGRLIKGEDLMTFNFY